ncbi:MAG TPA: hypothetical protein VN903_22520 [Polyangia bacterium]|nr:hypothetical protein [Polyangia bacterium]
MAYDPVTAGVLHAPGRIYRSTQVNGSAPVTAGPPVNPAALQRDPVTGHYFDPTSGKVYADPNGTQQVVDPNVRQQVAANFARSQAVFSQLPQAQAQQQQGFAGQSALVGNLNGVINGTAGPSVAQTQLGAGVGDIARSAISGAAGQTGESAALAHIQAMRTAGDAQAKANQDAAMLRAQETAAARATLGNVLGQQATEGQQNVNTTLGAANESANTAATGGATAETLNEKAGEHNAETNKGWIDQGAHFLGSLF